MSDNSRVVLFLISCVVRRICHRVGLQTAPIFVAATISRGEATLHVVFWNGPRVSMQEKFHIESTRVSFTGKAALVLSTIGRHLEM